MQVIAPLAIGSLLVIAGPRRAGADDAAVAAQADAPRPAQTDLRLTLSTFLYRETGDAAPPLVDMGAEVPSASPVRRYFGDLRIELTDGGFELDGRVRQTASERYQSGATGDSEYELRSLRLRAGTSTTSLIVGRQFIDAAGATKIDGVAVERALTAKLRATLFGGAFPQLGSRSLDTDYPEIRLEDGSEGSPLIPITGGLGAAYTGERAHGSLGLVAVHVMQDVPAATPEESSRVFLTANGYARPARMLDIYHFALLDVAGASGVNLTNGSLGINAQPASDLQLSLALHHVSTDILQIAARNVLTDPDPTAIGIVQNNIAVIRVSQDLVRTGASLALARSRFELSTTAGVRRRPALDVALADGGTVAFPEARSADLTMAITDRRSLAKLRVTASATLTYPLGDNLPNRARGTVARLSAGRVFFDNRGEVEADVMVERFRDLSGGGMCSTSLDPFTCYGASSTTAAQAGALASWRVAREWLLLADAHVGVRSVSSTSITGTVDYPAAYSLTAFLRAQWRYR